MRQMLRLMFPYARRINDKIHMPWCVPRGEVEVLLELGGAFRISAGEVDERRWCAKNNDV